MKCKERGVNLMVLDEAYTTKTCTNCGWIHETIGGRKVFECSQCQVKVDRDINGGRNIYLKHHKRLMGASVSTGPLEGSASLGPRYSIS
jgi:transposase